MEFTYRLTIWECIVCGAKRAFGYLTRGSRFFRTSVLILGGAALLSVILEAVHEGSFRMAPVIIAGCGLLLLSVFTWALLIPVEVVKIYRRCGKRERTVRIEDGSIFVKDGGTVSEYPCRNILELKKQGRLYRIAMTWRLGSFVELYLPVRLIGGREEQEAFRRYVNDQRKISGDKLILEKGEVKEEWEPDEGCICQDWTMEKMTAAMAESCWIGTHCMKSTRWRMMGSKNSWIFLLLAGMCLISIFWQSRIGVFGVMGFLMFWGSLIIRMMHVRTPVTISQQAICDALKRDGVDTPNNAVKIYFTPQGIRRIAPLLENTWAWSEVGYLFESDEYFHFYSLNRKLMLYMEKRLLGDWMAQKLFIQDCQAKGISYQIVNPEYIRDMQSSGDGEAAAGEQAASEKNGIYVLDGGRTSKKQEPDKKVWMSKKREERRMPDTQEGWRKFWAEKETERGGPERLRVIVTVLAVIGIFLLAFLLPDFRSSQGLGGVPVMMDMPADGEEYVFHPESYENYVPLADQVTTLESLGFTIPEEMVEEMERGMEEMPMARAWIEGYPYASILSAIGMPEWDYDAWKIIRYSDQAYWFDWEGFNLSREYIHILEGVNAMAGGDFEITDAEQDMSEADWEKGTGTIYVRFRIKGEPYEYKMKLMNDWLDSDIIKDLNDALKKAGVEKRVYAMDDDGQGCILFCRDKEWAKRFRKETGLRLKTK